MLNFATFWCGKTNLQQVSNVMSYLVFAYGSNMCQERMRYRIASATRLSVGMLQGYHLVIHKRSIDGSGKANARYTGQPDHATWGAVYRIARDHKPVLDKIEFLASPDC